MQIDRDPGDENPDRPHHAPADAGALQELHEHFHRPPWRPSDRHRCEHKGVIGSLIRCVCGWVGR